MSISVEDIRKSMRISHTLLDEEIERNTQSCLLDLKRVGVDSGTATSLRDKACEWYCKWQFDYQGKAEQYKKDYEQLRDAMSLSEEYKCTMKA